MSQKQSGEGIGTAVPGAPDDEAGSRTVADALEQAGVFVLATARRYAAAVALASAGVTADQIRDLTSFVLESEESQVRARRCLAALLVDPNRAMESLAALGKYRKAVKIAKEPKPMTEAQPYKNPFAGEPRWARGTNRRIVFARIVHDRKSVADVATETGLSIAVVEELLAEERAERDAVAAAMIAKEKPEEAESQDERVKRFRAQMHRTRA